MTTPQNPADLLTPEQAAQVLGLSVKTLATWRSTGRHSLPYIRIGVRIRYQLADIDNWLEGRRLTCTTGTPTTPVNARQSRQSARAKPAFDPALTLIRIPDLMALTGYARATIYKRLKHDPTFPKPVKLSDSTAKGAPVAFVLAEVQNWIQGRINA